MNKDTPTYDLTWLVYVIIISFFMLAGTVYGQTEVGYSNFGKTQKGLTVVEFWADWNERNMCHWVRDFRDIKFYRLDIGEYAGTADEYGIKVLPTIILFDNGEEVIRFQGDIQFKLCPQETPKKLQEAIDGILVGRF